MTHQEKVARAIRELTQKGVNDYTAAPPLFRALWAAGLGIPPPFFISFGPLLLFMAVSFGTLFGLLLWVAEWWTIRLPLGWLVLACVSAALLFGLCMALYYRRRASRLGLPSGNEYGEG